MSHEQFDRRYLQPRIVRRRLMKKSAPQPATRKTPRGGTVYGLAGIYSEEGRSKAY